MMGGDRRDLRSDFGVHAFDKPLAMTPSPPRLSSVLLAPVTINRAIKVALVVGTLLVALNHADSILAGQWPAWWKIILTYLVPYSVSSYSTAMFILDSRRATDIIQKDTIQ